MYDDLPCSSRKCMDEWTDVRIYRNPYMVVMIVPGDGAAAGVRYPEGRALRGRLSIRKALLCTAEEGARRLHILQTRI